MRDKGKTQYQYEIKLIEPGKATEKQLRSANDTARKGFRH